MSIIGQQIAEYKLRCKYVKKSTKKQLIQCIFEHHVPENHHYQGIHGDFLKNSWHRRCKHCGILLWPDKWEPVETVESDCEHEAIGYYDDSKKQISNNKLVNRFPQKCKNCGIHLKPKTWTRGNY